MIVALYILIALIGVGIILKMTDRPKNAADEGAEIEKPETECCGLHLVCEKVKDAAVADEIEYFDDEELDEFAGREPNGYSDNEIEKFRDVMLTLPAGEAALWATSLEKRGIALPSSLRDELLLLISD